MSVSMADELNIASQESMRSLPYEQYFGEMELTDEEKEERIALAEKFEKEFLFILSLIVVMQEHDTIQWDSIQAQIESRYRNALQGVIDVDDYVEDYIRQFSSDMVDSSKRNENDAYNTSYDRARYISENESNLMYNHKGLADAIKAGKTKKTWVTMRDKRVRKTHRALDGKTIKITDAFFVGDSMMMFPADRETYSASATECVNCRCTCKYS